MTYIRLGYAEGSCFTCSDNQEVELGQDIQIYLNPDRFTDLVTNPIDAVITAITYADPADPEEVNFDKVYVARFDETLLPTGISAIKTCDLDPDNAPSCKACMSNCELEEAVVNIQTDLNSYFLLPIVTDQESHSAADTNTAIASGQGYRLTGDRAIYQKD